MADYSQYGPASAEWTELVPDDPADLFAHGFVDDIASRPIQYVEELQRTANSRQIEAASKVMQQLGLNDTVDTADVEVKSSAEGTIPLRLYWGKKHRGSVEGTTKRPVYLYFHGGGYMFGTLSGEDANCASIANALDVLVINVCYRHTPQYRFPTQRTDALDSYNWTIKHAADFGGDAERIIVGGISAGGGLAAWLTLGESKKSDRIKGQVLGVPWLLQPSTFPFHLIKSRELSSPVQCRDAPVLPLSKLNFFEYALQEESPQDQFVDLDDEKLNELKSLPRTAMLVAGRDVLRDEALLFGENLKKLR